MILNSQEYDFDKGLPKIISPLAAFKNLKSACVKIIISFAKK